MTSTNALLLLAGGWLITGLITGLVMGRRGHSPITWAIIGAVLGPLAIPVAIASAQPRPEARAREVAWGHGDKGPIRVLVGIDGSPGGEAAARAAIEILGERMGQLTLAAVIDFDTAHRQPEPDERKQALSFLAQQRAKLGADYGVEAATVLLAGEPAEALLSHATEGGFGMLAVGSRGRGAAKLVLGSVASKLARQGAVPVLIAPSVL